MVSDALTRMLILQDRDMKLQQVEADLVSIPKERRACEARIATLQAEIEASRQRIKELETKGRSIETEMASVEEQVVKYKNQQILVKKNEEYQALTHEIAAASEKISELESSELEVLYELDEARKVQKVAEEEIAARIERERADLGKLDEREQRVSGELAGAKEAFAKAEAALDKPTLSKYRQVARGLKFPVIVALSDQKCSGCHMRVSNAIDSEVRAASEITTCDNCGRILYSEA